VHGPFKAPKLERNKEALMAHSVRRQDKLAFGAIRQHKNRVDDRDRRKERLQHTGLRSAGQFLTRGPSSKRRSDDDTDDKAAAPQPHHHKAEPLHAQLKPNAFFN